MIILNSCGSYDRKNHLNETSNKKNNLDVLINKSDELYEKDNYIEAINVFNEIILIDSTIGKIYYRRAYCKTQLNQFESSINDLKKAIELNYELDKSYFILAMNYSNIHNDSLAIKCLQQASDINPLNLSYKRWLNKFKKRAGDQTINYLQLKTHNY